MKTKTTKNTVSVMIIAVMTAMVTLFVTGCQSSRINQRKGVEVKNEDLYKNGVFQADKAKDAYYALMKSFNYPIYPILKTDNFWVCDFMQGDMKNLGMGGIFWINEKGEYGKTGCKKYKGKFKGQQFGYLGHDIFLLPNQVLPEHDHIGGPEGFGPKMEAWQVRHGEVDFFSELAAPGGDEMLISDMPENERPWGYGEPWFKCKYVVKRKAGEIYKLADPESFHFQRAGKDGAIVTEYATYHNDVRFSKPGMAFANSGDKK
jgi:hypothetical protein